MTPQEALCVEYELYYAYQHKVKYVWGGTDLAKGADCSGAIFRACRRCGVPVVRTTAYRMMNHNANGWEGPIVGIEDAYPGATLIGFTLKPERPQGHTALAVDYYGESKLKFFHMSWSRRRAQISIIRTQPPNWWALKPKVYKSLLDKPKRNTVLDRLRVWLDGPPTSKNNAKTEK